MGHFSGIFTLAGLIGHVQTYQVVVVLKGVVQLCDPASVSLQQHFPFLLVTRRLQTTQTERKMCIPPEISVKKTLTTSSCDLFIEVHIDLCFYLPSPQHVPLVHNLQSINLLCASHPCHSNLQIRQQET